MECRYHVYINTVATDTLNTAIMENGKPFLTGADPKNEYPITDVILHEYAMNTPICRSGWSNYKNAHKHVIVIDDPDVSRADFVSKSEVVEQHTFECDEYPAHKLFLAVFDVGTEFVKIRGCNPENKILFESTIYFLTASDLNTVLCGTDMIPNPQERVYSISSNCGFINFIFNPWGVDSTHAYVSVGGMTVEYASSTGGTNMMSLRDPSTRTDARLIQIKDEKIISWRSWKTPQDPDKRTYYI